MTEETQDVFEDEPGYVGPRERPFGLANLVLIFEAVKPAPKPRWWDWRWPARRTTR